MSPYHNNSLVCKVEGILCKANDEEMRPGHKNSLVCKEGVILC